MKKKLLTAILLILAAAVIAIGSFWLGRTTAVPASSQTFYAEIESINKGSYVVKGLDVNDINFRGHFRFGIDDDTVLRWHYTEITESDLEVGDKISITFEGPVAESYPGEIAHVSRIILLDDEK